MHGHTVHPNVHPIILHMKIEDYKDDEEVIKPDKPDKPEKKIIKPKVFDPEPIDENIEYPENKPPVVGRLGPTEEELIERRKLIDKLRKELIIDEPIIYTKSGEYKKASELTLYEQEDEIIKCKTNPIYFICTYLTIFDQTQGEGGLIIPFKLFPFQIDLINAYIDNRFVIPNKYRQAGISTCTCAYIAWYVMFNKNRSVAIVANKQMMAENELMKDVVDFIDGCPIWLKPKTGKIERLDKNGKKYGKDLKDTQALKIYDNGSTLAAFSSKGLRGYTPTLLYWDEVAWTEKNDVFWTATRPTLQTGGAAILVSTPQGLDSVYYKTFEEARKGKNNFHAVELWWFNDPRYNKELAWYKNKGQTDEIKIDDNNFSYEKRLQLKEDGWEASSPWLEEQIVDANGDIRKIRQELLCSFLGSGDNFIAELYLKRIEDNEIQVPLRQEYIDLNMWIFEDPIKGEQYIMGVDASPGHGDDNSTINILKKREIIEEKLIVKNGKEKLQKIRRYEVEQVAEYYGKLPPDQLAEMAYQYGKAYNDAYIVVDVTGGYGIQSVTKLMEYGYNNFHYAEVSHKPTRDQLSGYIKKGQRKSDGTLIDLVPGFFIGNNRASVLLELQRSIHLKLLTIKSQRTLSELKTFVTVAGNRVADHKRTFHDDSIMGMSIGLYVINYEMVRGNRSKSFDEKMLNALLTTNDINRINKERGVAPKPRMNINPNHPLNPYIVNNWLFYGMKPK